MSVPYVRSLDGFRGLAIAAVMLFHFGFLPIGWIGVQAFFVLSGYLITAVLLADKEAPLRGYLGRFYWRRALRIFPVNYGFLLVLAVMYVGSGRPASFLLPQHIYTPRKRFCQRALRYHC